MWVAAETDVQEYYRRQFKYASLPMLKGQVWETKSGIKYEVIEDLGGGVVKAKIVFDNGFGIVFVEKAVLTSKWED